MAKEEHANNFWTDESGAITVDWVVLTAGIVGLAGIVYTYLSGPVDGIDAKTGSALSSVSVPKISFD
ncbi:MAG: hypothetical protein AB3N21_01835 [Ruegeria sp.]|uniref:hypothetical protein n=1 Tax=Ruegeria sp. TaxID=1879320 RepID=UPI00349EC23B